MTTRPSADIQEGLTPERLRSLLIECSDLFGDLLLSGECSAFYASIVGLNERIIAEVEQARSALRR